MPIPEDCPKYGSCAAPMCPLDPDHQHAVWYPAEGICKRTDLAPIMRRTQFKLRRKAKPRRYYTYRMLSYNWRVCKNVLGLDPDARRSEAEQEKRFLRRHLPYQPSEKQMEHTKKLGKKMQKKKRGTEPN